MKRAWIWILEYLLRWFPSRVGTGLIRAGKPDRSSPVFCTANFTLTVRRLLGALNGLDAWVLVADTGGINVWCSAASRQFNAHSVIEAIKLSGIGEQVDHRRIIMPQLAAPGVDSRAVKESAGWKLRFGPVYAKDIPQYLSNNGKKTEAMRRADFGWKHRLEMIPSMMFPIWLVVLVIAAIFSPANLPAVTVIFWAAVLVLVMGYPILPGRNGWEKAVLVGIVLAALVMVWGWMESGAIFGRWGLGLATFLMAFAVGFDLGGIVAPAPSDAEAFVIKLGFKDLGFLMKEKDIGLITLDRECCIGCQGCFDVCPVRVFGERDGDKKTTLPDKDACFICGACVMQCPEGCLSLS